MKKTNFIIFLTFIMLFVMFFATQNISALTGGYNGTSTPGKPSHEACPESTSPNNLCVYNNGNHATIRISFIKFNKTGSKDNKAQLGHAVYYTNSDYKIDKVTYLDIKGNVKTESTDGYIEKRNFFVSNNSINSSKLKSYYVKSGETIRKNVIDTISQMDVNSSLFGTKTAFVNHLQDIYDSNKDIYYRFVIEPVYSFWDGSKIVYYTPKAVAKSGKSLTRNARWCELGSLMYTTKNDVCINDGKKENCISKGSYCGTVDSCSSYTNAKNLLSNSLNGTGYNIIDFTENFDPQPKKCDYNNPDHFTKNVNKQKKSTAKEGSGPNGENCCNLDLIPSATKEKIIDTYLKQYKKEFNKTISRKEFEDVFYQDHFECLPDPDPDPVVTKASCYGSGEAEYDQGASTYDMLASSVSEKGETNVNASKSQYLRQTITSYGKILCSEKLTLSLPVNYQSKVDKGQLLEWPTYENGLRLNQYPLTLEGTANCVLTINRAQLIEDNTTRYTCNCHTTKYEGGSYTSCSTCKKVNWDAVNSTTNSIINTAMDWKRNPSSHYDVKGNFYVRYADKKYGGTFNIDRYDNGYKNYKLTGFSFGVTGGTFSINQVTRYKIKESTYKYIIKKNNQESESVHTLPSNVGNNYINVGYGNLPIANDAEKGIYPISILYNNLGGFPTNKFATSTTAYNCSYQIDEEEVPCTCDLGTAMAGKDLTACQTGGCDGKTYTCAEAKKKFCSYSPCQCPDDSKAAGKDLSNYVYQGMSCSQAQSSYCNTPNITCPSGTDFQNQELLTTSCNSNYNCKMLTCNVYVCPDDTDYSGKNMNAMIANYLAKKGGTLNNTILKRVYKLYCNGVGDNIIYRVIDLNNPFPGQSGDGRDAGYNWSAAEDVKNYITNNRGVKTDKIYNKNNVMYHFKLTAKTINAIRSYNSTNDYSDFKLTCKASNGRNCISNFVHNTTYGLQSDSKCYTTGSFTTCR